MKHQIEGSALPGQLRKPIARHWQFNRRCTAHFQDFQCVVLRSQAKQWTAGALKQQKISKWTQFWVKKCSLLTLPARKWVNYHALSRTRCIWSRPLSQQQRSAGCYAPDSSESATCLSWIHTLLSGHCGSRIWYALFRDSIEPSGIYFKICPNDSFPFQRLDWHLLYVTWI